MRIFYVLAIICVAGSIYAIPTYNYREPDAYKDSDWIFSTQSVECATKSNFNIVAFKRQVGDIPDPLPAGYEVPKGFYCYMACIMTKDFKPDEYGHKKTLEEAFTDIIDYYADNALKNTNYTRQDVEVVTNRCTSRGLNNCDYLKCIKFFEPPIFTLYKNY